MNMKKNGISLIVCIMLLGSSLPIVGAECQITRLENISDSNYEKAFETQNPLENDPMMKYILIGRITNLTIEEVPFLGNVTYFTAVKVIFIQIFREDDSKAIGLVVYTNVPVAFPELLYQFRGILTDRFICGVYDINMDQ